MNALWVKRSSVAFAALALWTIAASPAWAQRQGRGFGGGNLAGALVGLASQKSVQDELKVTDEQAKKIGELVDHQREVFSGLRELEPEERRKKLDEQMTANKTAIAGILNEVQFKRLNQISLQQRGARAFADAEVADALQLTPEQKEKVRAIQQEAQSQAQEAMQAGDRSAARTKVQEIRKTADEKSAALLTPEQQGKWKTLTGEPFKGEIAPPRGRGRNRPGTAGG